MIEETYVSFETAKLLKEKGFNQKTTSEYAADYIVETWYDDYREKTVRYEHDKGYFIEPCTEIDYNIYGKTIPAPTQQMAMRWLREINDIIIIIIPSVIQSDDLEWVTSIRTYNKEEHFLEEQGIVGRYNSYEQACEAAIQYCLENLI